MYLKNIDLEDEKNFPLFIKKLEVKKFRSIVDLDINFIHPLTVLTGTNKIGKTSILAMMACSHAEFQMRNLGTGEFERCTWSRLIKFTTHDIQSEEWRYRLVFKSGKKIEDREGWRSVETRKWSGLAKRTGQILERKVFYIDVDRITPAHACSNVLFVNTQNSPSTSPIAERVKKYFDYIFELNFEIAEIAKHQNRTSYKMDSRFTNFNSASGEDVLLSILLDSVRADNKSLILIDELELGLHPKIQRRLVEVLQDIAATDQKQFIVTTHSPTLLSSFDKNSRIFIEKKDDNSYLSMPRVNVNVAFSKMDSEIFPLLNLFCEDAEAVRFINKALENLKNKGHRDIQKIINIIPSGAASVVKENYEVYKRTWGKARINIGYAAVYDGDQQSNMSAYIGTDDKIAFLYSNESPEKFLLRNYLNKHPNSKLLYHLENSPSHLLFSKCIDESIATNEYELFDILYGDISESEEFREWLEEFEIFLLDAINYFSDKI